MGKSERQGSFKQVRDRTRLRLNLRFLTSTQTHQSLKRYRRKEVGELQSQHSSSVTSISSRQEGKPETAHSIQKRASHVAAQSLSKAAQSTATAPLILREASQAQPTGQVELPKGKKRRRRASKAAGIAEIPATFVEPFFDSQMMTEFKVIEPGCTNKSVYFPP